jgi:hypothetical protein
MNNPAKSSASIASSAFEVSGKYVADTEENQERENFDMNINRNIICSAAKDARRFQIANFKFAIVFLSVLCALCGEKVWAQNFTVVTASSLQDLTGSKLANGQVCFQAATNSGVPISYEAGGGGQVINVPRCASVINGSFSLSVANTALTTPAHICYKVTVKDESTGQYVLGNGQPGMASGYECVQPTGSNFNFDNFAPSLAPLVTVVQGAVISGTPMAGDCAAWVSPFLLGDAGAPCGTGAGSGGGGTWGSIAGTLANQTDLQSALNVKANVSGLAAVATSGSYNDLTNKPAIPPAQINSDWNATSGLAQIVNKPALAAVAISGSYSDLANQPAIPSAQVNSDWNAASGVAQVLNKPALGTAAAQPASAFLAVPSVTGLVKSTGSGAAAAATSSDVIAALGYTPASTSAVPGNVVTITADNTGATDVSAAVSAALTTIYNDGGGTVSFPAGTFLIGSQIVIPNNGAHPPKHPAISIQCAGGNFSLDGTAPVGGTILNMTYSGAVAKLADFAFGTLEISGCTFQETGATTTTPFLMTTNATLQLHDNFVSGYAGNNGTANDQDFLILGGTGTATTGDSTGWFQGYGGYIMHNFAQHIRRFAYLQSAANSIPITENTMFATCGSNLAGGAAIELGTSTQPARGNEIRDNLIESPYYPYPIKVVSGNQNTLLNQFWDCNSTGTVTAALYDFEAGAGTNFVYEGFHDQSCPVLYRDLTGPPGQVVFSSSLIGGTQTGGPAASLGATTLGADLMSQGVSTRTSGLGVVLRWNNTSGNSSNWHGENFAYNYATSTFQGYDIDGNPLSLNALSGGQVTVGGSLFATGNSFNPSAGSGVMVRYSGTQGQVYGYNYTTSAYLPLLLDGAGVYINQNGGMGTFFGNSTYVGGNVGVLPTTGTYLTNRISGSQGQIFAYNYAGSGTLDPIQIQGSAITLTGPVAASSTLSATHINQPSSNNHAGTCTMSSSTSCTWTLASAYTSTPICVASVQGVTAIAVACSVSGTAVTITAASSNSQTWGAVLVGNPN